MDDLVTVDLIIGVMKKWVEEKIPIDSHKWADAAQKLNILLGDEHDKLFHMEQMVAGARVKLLNEGNSVAFVNRMIEATDEYREARSQSAKIKRVEEQIKIAKVQARLKDAELRGY